LFVAKASFISFDHGFRHTFARYVTLRLSGPTPQLQRFDGSLGEATVFRLTVY